MLETPAGSEVSRRIILGKVSGIYGVAGWIKVFSYTRPKENILEYPQWMLGDGDQWQELELIEGKIQGKGIIARLRGLDDRDEARKLIGQVIAIYRNQLAELSKDEIYWCDLMGLDVQNLEGVQLGKVTDIYETGANDVLVVTGELRYLIPLVLDRFVIKIDHNKNSMIVDWDPGYS
jgi:16S rRNA processing protein RimM